ncbi:MAG: hypothetical protein IT436_12245 [Phycisphaerales bacterium]|nr:hypothetical protein [Phycisphaerales bacterium]
MARLAGGANLYLTDSAGPASYFFASKEWRGGLDAVGVVMPEPVGQRGLVSG